MSATILNVPVSYLALARVQEEWDRAAMDTARAYGCWLFGDELPHWLIAAWEHFLIGSRQFGLNDTSPRDVSWSRLWCDFTNGILAYQPEWKRAVERSLAEMETAS